ncbi:MAG TPA: transglycosylase family protein [Propionibacteriaceae bacterium]|nr:transglycosylase family protein [Propionibacteriaceae bacterium]
MARSKITQRMVGVVAAAALSVGVGAATAAPAEAASNVWDRVAKCESGGNWKISTGNGYYGGLQFSKSTWRGYGGGKYASTANRATKAEQIAIARRTLAGQGPGAWPVCSRKAGLTRSNGKASKTATPSGNPSGSKSVVKKRVVKKATSTKSTYTSSAGKTIKVRSGDTLAKIANRNDVQGGWRGLWRLNKSRLDNPNFIRVGQVLRIK